MIKLKCLHILIIMNFSFGNLDEKLFFFFITKNKCMTNIDVF